MSSPSSTDDRDGRSDVIGSLLWPLALVLAAAGVILAARLAGELATTMTAGSHHDFLAFFAAGRLVLDGRASGLYDAASLTAVQRTVLPVPVGMNGYMPFINPPFAAVAFAPLAALPAGAGRAVWAALSVAMLFGAAMWIGRPLAGRARLATVLLIVLSYPAYHSLAEAQWSAAMLLGGVAALQAARAGSWRLAGLALATWWLKPQLILLPLVALALDRRWTAVRWSMLGGVALAVASLPFVGLEAWATYLRYLVEVGVSHFNGAGTASHSVWQGDLASTEGLNGLLVGTLGQGSVLSVNLLWAVLGAGLLGLWLLACRTRRPGFETPDGRRVLAAGVGIVLLLNPNLFRQDCLLVFLLLPALWPAARRDYWRATVGVASLAALTLLDEALSLHLFTVALLAIVAGWCALTLAGRRAAIRDPGRLELDRVG
jgi:hypothetical protein